MDALIGLPLLLAAVALVGAGPAASAPTCAVSMPGAVLVSQQYTPSFTGSVLSDAAAFDIAERTWTFKLSAPSGTLTAAAWTVFMHVGGQLDTSDRAPSLNFIPNSWKLQVASNCVVSVGGPLNLCALNFDSAFTPGTDSMFVCRHRQGSFQCWRDGVLMVPSSSSPTDASTSARTPARRAGAPSQVWPHGGSDSFADFPGTVSRVYYVNRYINDSEVRCFMPLTFVAQPIVTNLFAGEITIAASIGEPGTVWCAAYDNGSSAPSPPSTVKAEEGAANAVQGDPVSITVEASATERTYNVWCYAERSGTSTDSDDSVLAAEALVVVVVDGVPPVFTSVDVGAVNSTCALLTVSLDEPGTVWCALFPDGEAGPTSAATVKNHTYVSTGPAGTTLSLCGDAGPADVPVAGGVFCAAEDVAGNAAVDISSRADVCGPTGLAARNGSGQCVDVDECARSDNGGCAQACVNLPLSYSCGCDTAGYTATPGNASDCTAVTVTLTPPPEPLAVEGLKTAALQLSADVSPAAPSFGRLAMAVVSLDPMWSVVGYTVTTASQFIVNASVRANTSAAAVAGAGNLTIGIALLPESGAARLAASEMTVQVEVRGTYEAVPPTIDLYWRFRASPPPRVSLSSVLPRSGSELLVTASATTLDVSPPLGLLAEGAVEWTTVRQREPMTGDTQLNFAMQGDASQWFSGPASFAVRLNASASPQCSVAGGGVTVNGTRLLFSTTLPDDPLLDELGLRAALGRADAVDVPLSSSELWHECGDLRLQRAHPAPEDAGLAVFDATCTLPPVPLGAGLRLALVGNNGTESLGSPLVTPGAVYSAPAPTIINGTLRASLDAAGSSTLVFASTVRQPVVFDARNVPLEAAYVRVVSVSGVSGTETTETAETETDCADVSVTERDGSAVSLRCLALGNIGAVSRFRVYVAGQSDTGSDVYSFVAPPRVDSVSGCADGDDGNGTAGCDTAGTDTLTLRGAGFAGQPLVTVAGLACNVLIADAALITCEAPPGTGTRQLVTVTTSLGLGTLTAQSAPRLLVSYAAPVITAVSSPNCAKSTTLAVAVERCPRDLRFAITIDGRHFSEGAEAFVGGTRCGGSVVRELPAAGAGDASTERLTCVAEPGTALNLAVVIVQRNGGALSLGRGGSGQQALLSFEQCPCGTHINASSSDAACVPCSRNTYQPDEGQFVCRSCPAGQYLRFAGTDAACDSGASCDDCPDGGDCAPGLPVTAQRNRWLYEEDARAAKATNSAGTVLSVPCEPGRCRDASSCFTSNAERQATLERSDFAHFSCCAPGRLPAANNPGCGACLAGRSEWSGECVECTSVSGGLVVAFLLLGVALLLALERLTRRSSGAAVKIVVAFAQILYTFFAAEESSPVAGSALLSFSPLDLSPVCVVPVDDLTKAVLPVVQIFVVLVLLAALALFNAAHWAWRRCQQPAETLLKFKRSPFMRVLVALMLFAYVPSLRVALGLVRCVSVNGTQLLRRYPTVECAGGAYKAWTSFVWLLCAALLLGVGAFVAFFGQRVYRRWARRHELAISSIELAALRKAIEERYGFLFMSYRARADSDADAVTVEAVRAGWEAVVLLRSTAFVAAAAVVDDAQSRFALLALIAFVALLQHLAAQPYGEERENRMESVALGVMTVVGTLNSTSWSGTTAVRTLTAVLAYGFVAAVVAAAVVRAWQSGRLQRGLSRARSRLSSSRPASAPLGLQAAASATATWAASAFCWYNAAYRPKGADKPANDAAAGARGTSSAASIELAAPDEAGAAAEHNDNDGDAPSDVVDSRGRAWVQVQVPYWVCRDDSNETSWNRPE